MIPVGTAVGFLNLDYSNFTTGLNNAVNEATIASGRLSQTIGSGLSTIGSTMANAGKTMTMGITLPLATAGAATVKFGAGFDKQMSEVQAVSGATSKQMDQMRDAAIGWGEKTVYTATEAGKALYYMGLAGWEPQKSVAALGPVLNLAAAGNLNLGRSSDIVTDAMTAMNYNAGELTKGIENTQYFTNSLAAAMSNSNTDVDQMGEAFKYVSPLAGSLGMDINDLSLTLGLMANVGVKGSQAGTGLRQALKNMIKPTDDCIAVMKKYNVSLFDGEGRAKNMRVFLEELRGKFGGLSIDIHKTNGDIKTGEEIMEEYGDKLPITQQQKLNAVVELFGTRALPGMLGIIDQPQESFEKLANAVDNSNEAFVEHEGKIMTFAEAVSQFGEDMVRTSGDFEILGAAEGMARMQMDNLQGDWTKFTSALGTSQIVITDLVKGGLRDLVQKLTELVVKFNNMDPAQQKNILKIVAMVAALGPLLFIFGTIIGTVGKAIMVFNSLQRAFMLVKTGAAIIGTHMANVGQAMSLARAGFTSLAAQASPLGAALGAISAPVLAVIAVIGILIAAFVTLWNTNEDFRNKIIEIWEGVKASFQDAFDRISQAISSLGINFDDLGKAISGAWLWFCNALAPIIIAIFQTAAAQIQGFITIVSGVVQVIVGIIKGFKDGDWSLFLQGLKTIWDGVLKTFTAPFIAIFNAITAYLNSFGITWQGIWQGISTSFTNLWNGIQNTFSTIWNNIKTTVFSIVISIVNTVISNMFMWKQNIELVLSTIQTVFSIIWNAITSFIVNTVDNIKNIIDAGFNFIKNTIDTILNVVSTIFTNIWNGIRSFMYQLLVDIVGKVNYYIHEIKQIIDTVFTTVKNIVTTIWNNIQTTIISIVTTIWAGVKQKFEDIKTAVVTILTTMKDAAVEKMTAVKDGLINVFVNIFDKFTDVGRRIIDGIKQGISNGWDELISWVSDLASSLLDSAKNALGIASPSKKFRDEVGKWIPLGIADGFAKSMPTAVSDIQNSLDRGLGSLNENKIDVVGVSDVFRTTVEDVVDWFTSIESRLSDVVEDVKYDLSQLIDVGSLISNPTFSISDMVLDRQRQQGYSTGITDTKDTGSVNNFTFYSNESIDELQAVKLFKETQRDLAEGFY